MTLSSLPSGLVRLGVSQIEIGSILQLLVFTSSWSSKLYFDPVSRVAKISVWLDILPQFTCTILVALIETLQSEIFATVSKMWFTGSRFFRLIFGVLPAVLCFVSLEEVLPRERLAETELLVADDARCRVDFSLFLSRDLCLLSSFLFRLRLLLSLEEEEDEDVELGEVVRLLPPLDEDGRRPLPRHASVTWPVILHLSHLRDLLSAVQESLL